MRSILVPVEDHRRMNDVLDATLAIATAFDSYVEGVALGPDITEMVAADFSMSGAIFDDRTRLALLRGAAATFEAFMAARAVPRRKDDGEAANWAWRGAALMSPTAVGEYGRTFDLLVVGRPGAGSHEPHRSTLEAVLFESGRPLMIVPPVPPPPTLGETIAVAWNGSTETARSIAFAMPFLLRAKDVPVLAVPGLRLQGPSDAQVAAGLRRPGLPARVVAVADKKGAPARALLDMAGHLGCDLMVKGGYTQSRLRQLIFGGVTSGILAEAELPIFMAH